MRISAMTVLAFSVAALAGCGGVVSSCTRVALKAGGTAGKGTAVIGTETGLKGAGLAGGAHTMEHGAAGSTLGKAAAESEAGAFGLKPAANPLDDAARAGDDTSGLQQGADSDPSFLEEVGKEALQQGADKLPDAFGGGQRSNDDN